MIFAAFAGTGKTTLAKLHPDTAVDFVCMPYKYALEPLADGDDGEAAKADLSRPMREDWPRNYVAAIKEAMGGGKTLLIPTDWWVLALLQAENIPYTLCYPERSAKEAYRRRFLERGNTQTFIDIFIGRWDRFMDQLEQDSYGRHIVMKEHEYLTDAISN